MQLWAVTVAGTVELHDDELRERAADVLARIAAAAASPEQAKRKGRPPGTKNRSPAAPGEDNGVVETTTPAQS